MQVLNERRVTSLVLLLIGAALLSNTFGQQYADLGGAFSPMFFPRIILWLWLGLERPRLLRVAIIALGTLAFLWSMTRLGFFLSAVPFTLLALVTLDIRRPLPMLAVAVGVPIALVALFNHVLTLPLPTSPFTWWDRIHRRGRHDPALHPDHEPGPRHPAAAGGLCRVGLWGLDLGHPDQHARHAAIGGDLS